MSAEDQARGLCLIGPAGTGKSQAGILPISADSMKAGQSLIVLDPQGNAVRDAMRHLGMPEVRSVRIGKYMEIEVDGEDVDLEKRLHSLCRDLLSNPVIEDYELVKTNGAKTSEVRKKK